jgi:MoCo/4Fe-4S cofactor protein with predicted Tat translocation signal
VSSINDLAGSGRLGTGEKLLASHSGATKRGHDGWWRTLDEQADDPHFVERLYNEFPSEIEAITDPVARRTFLKLMGASLALAGVTACTRQPAEKIVPYVRQPEELIPGKPLFYATSMALGGVATGLLVESHEGRPTKVEGNPLHPGSLGATDVFAQAAILGLYDPDRSQTLTNLGDIRPWSAFLGAIRAALTAQQPLKGAGLRILTESVSSPTLAAQIRDVLTRYPSAKWHQWDPASRESAREGARIAFGEHVDVQYNFTQADVILSLDADFLGSGPGGLRYARDFSARRRPEQADRMNRLYAIESMPTSTGARADHRLPLKPGEIERVAQDIEVAMRPSLLPGGRAVSGPHSKWINAVAKDLQSHRRRSLVIAGDSQPPSVHALAHSMNAQLENAGRTVVYTQPVEAEPVAQLDSLRDLVADMTAGRVDLLVIVGGNPVYTAPADLKFADALEKVQLKAHLSLYDDETSERCQWQIPEAHFLESWSDARAYDGTASIIQPLIAPLYGGKSAHEVIAAMSDRPERSAYDIVREHWVGSPERAALQGDAFESSWRRWLHDGVIAGTAFAPKPLAPLMSDIFMRPAAASAGIEISFRNDPSILDGRFANNGWLQELPKPITRLTWDNAVLVSPVTAAKLRAEGAPAFEGGEHGQIVSQVVELKYRGRSVRGALFPVVGHPDDCATVHLGYGRARAGHVGTGTGFNANAIRTSDALAFGVGAEIVATGEKTPLACTQYHHLMEGRGMVRAVTRDEFVRDPKSVHEEAGGGGAKDETPAKIITLYPAVEYTGYKWGHGDRRQRLHRLQRVRRRMSGGEQHPGHRQGSGPARTRDALAARGHVLSRPRGESRNIFPAGAVHAVRERAVRARLPGRRDGAQRRRPQRHGVQPLCRHALLLE